MATISEALLRNWWSSAVGATSRLYDSPDCILCVELSHFSDSCCYRIKRMLADSSYAALTCSLRKY